ncbi:hypothetical protein F4680DRAFT_452383 [Xylaria scruposa]|nr:hypothetical protein F4680DRAFT_452383 [Xylaria scruposa]
MADGFVKHPLEPPNITIADEVVIKYPYGEGSTLLSFPALDVMKQTDQNDIVGLHHFIVLTACGIITDNKFGEGEVYLTHDLHGQDRVTTPRHGLLLPGTYYLQVRGFSPDTSATAGTSSGTDITDQPASSGPYPIVSCFSAWVFPRGYVPEEWKPLSNLAGPSGNGCIIATDVKPTEVAHIIPSANHEWYTRNKMSSLLLRSSDTSIDSNKNKIRLRIDFHRLFNEGLYVFAPKPLHFNSDPQPGQPPQQQPSTDESAQLGQPGQPPQQQPSTNESAQLGFAVHFLMQEDVGGYVLSYHNISPNKQDIKACCFDFLFARFAWAIFRKLRAFWDTEDDVYVSWLKEDLTTGKMVRETTMATKKDITAHWSAMGETPKGGTKRKRATDQNGDRTANAGSDSECGSSFDSERGSSFDSESDSEGFDSDLDSEGSDRGKPRQMIDIESEVPLLGEAPKLTSVEGSDRSKPRQMIDTESEVPLLGEVPGLISDESSSDKSADLSQPVNRKLKKHDSGVGIDDEPQQSRSGQ